MRNEARAVERLVWVEDTRRPIPRYIITVPSGFAIKDNPVHVHADRVCWCGVARSAVPTLAELNETRSCGWMSIFY